MEKSSNIVNTDLVQMRHVEGGSFQMGSDDGDADSDEQPVHRVQVDSFYMGIYPVTQEQYREVIGKNPSYFDSKRDSARRPVEQVSWYDAVAFCNAMSRREGREEVYTINGERVSCDWKRNGYRLPTEAEWEYAAKGGAKSEGYTYAGSNTVGDVAWYRRNSGIRTHPVGEKQANELGLYDMSGNVWEWCWDWYDGEYYERSPAVNPTGPASGSCRVLRGGSWIRYAGFVHSADRYNYSPSRRAYFYGFRVLVPASSREEESAAREKLETGLVPMKYVEGGNFQMGSDDDGAYSDDQPVHRVQVDSFYMGIYPVTQEQYREVIGKNPSYFDSKRDSARRPVEEVSWYDAVAFCNAMSRREGREEVYTINGERVSCDWKRNGYRLPTEAEWEYAARGGVKSNRYRYAGSNDSDEVAWYRYNEGNETRPVGKKRPNELGLYDMSGNVYEWCWDWFDSEYYKKSPAVNPTGPASGSYRVLRGGSWRSNARLVRSARRDYDAPSRRAYFYGFRVLVPAV